MLRLHRTQGCSQIQNEKTTQNFVIFVLVASFCVLLYTRGFRSANRLIFVPFGLNVLFE